MGACNRLLHHTTRWLTGDPNLAPAGQPAMTEAPAVVDVARQAQARQYARQRRVLMLVNLGISAVAIAVLLFSGLSFWLRDALAPLAGWQPFAGWEPLRIAAYFIVLMVAVTVLDAPLSYYSGYVLPHRYGLSTQSLGGWLLDLAKGLAISLPLELVAVLFVYWLLAVAPLSWWLWTGLAVLIFTSLLANLAPILLLPLFYKLTPLPDGDVKRRALELAAQAHTKVRGIYSMNMSSKTTEGNAAVMGLGNTRRIVIGDTLLQQYTPDEIEVVLAHELGTPGAFRHPQADRLPDADHAWRPLPRQRRATCGRRQRDAVPRPRRSRHHAARRRGAGHLWPGHPAAHQQLQPPRRAPGRCLCPGLHRQDRRLHQRDDTPGKPKPG